MGHCASARDSTQCSTDMNKTVSIFAWLTVGLLGVGAVGVIAVHRGEPINALWLVVAATCCYALGYRFYSKFIAAKILALDALRATPAERLENGRDFLVTNKWVVFGHHFAAIAGPGPLVGPVLAAQFGYLPGTLWVLAGAVFAGCVQDFVILLFSVRRDGKSLTEMAKEEIGRVGGFVAYTAVIAILVILLGVAALIVVNALKDSPWGTFTIAMTIPIALLMGFYLRRIRPGKVLEVSVLGFHPRAAGDLGRTLGFAKSAHGAGLHVAGDYAREVNHCVRICRFRAPGVAAAGAPRLSQHVREAGHDRTPGHRHRSVAPHAAHARADSFCGRHRPSLRRKDLSLRLHHHRLRRHQRLPRINLQRHHAQTDRPRDSRPAWWAMAL